MKISFKYVMISVGCREMGYQDIYKISIQHDFLIVKKGRYCKGPHLSTVFCVDIAAV